MVIDFNNYYIQFMGFKKSKEIFCECVSNEFLNEKGKLNNVKIDNILKLNFVKPNEKDKEGNISPNYSKYYKANQISDFKEIYQDLIYLMT